MYLAQITDEESLALQHFLLVALCQMVEIGELVERRVAASEGRGRWQQERVERYQLSHVQLTLPENKYIDK